MPNQDNRPNFLLIMTDQQRGDCLGIEDHPVLLTPNLDHLAASGVRFRRAYSTCPVCIPARRSLMSGQFPTTHGMVGYRDGVDWDPPATLPGVLRGAGYQTGIVGRCMHLHPFRKRYGFDHMVISGGPDDDYRHWLDIRQPEGANGPRGAGMQVSSRIARPWHMAEHLHYTNWTINQALRHGQTLDPTCPFFLVVSFIAPHPPFNPPAFYFDRYLRQPVHEPVIGDWATPPPNDGKGAGAESYDVNLTGEQLRSCRAAYYGLINHIDDLVSLLFKDTAGGLPSERLRRTVTIFTSDHGEMLGDHYMFRKCRPFEGSARVPLIIHSGDLVDLDIQPGHVPDRPVCLEDIMPTVLEIAGLEVPPSVDGSSLRPLLSGGPEPRDWRPHLHGECTPFEHYLTDGQEKYIWNPSDGRELLFDLVRDPNELLDLASRPGQAERLGVWRNRLIEQLKGRPEGFTDGESLISGRKQRVMVDAD